MQAEIISNSKIIDQFRVDVTVTSLAAVCIVAAEKH